MTTQKDELSILYQRARDEWDERLGSVVKNADIWKLIAFLSLTIATLSVAGIIYIGSQSKIIPYAIAIKNNETIGVAAINKLPDNQLHALKTQAIKKYIEDLRNVMADVAAQKQALLRAYSIMPPGSPAYEETNRRFKAQSPFERAKSELIKVEINSVLPLSDDTYQAEWREIITNRQGKPIDTRQYKATLNTQTQLPTTQKALHDNPLGFFILTFNDVQVR